MQFFSYACKAVKDLSTVYCQNSPGYHFFSVNAQMFLNLRPNRHWQRYSNRHTTSILRTTSKNVSPKASYRRCIIKNAVLFQKPTHFLSSRSLKSVVNPFPLTISPLKYFETFCLLSWLAHVCVTYRPDRTKSMFWSHTFEYPWQQIWSCTHKTISHNCPSYKIFLHNKIRTVVKSSSFSKKDEPPFKLEKQKKHVWCSRQP